MDCTLSKKRKSSETDRPPFCQNFATFPQEKLPFSQDKANTSVQDNTKVIPENQSGGW